MREHVSVFHSQVERRGKTCRHADAELGKHRLHVLQFLLLQLFLGQLALRLGRGLGRRLDSISLCLRVSGIVLCLVLRSLFGVIVALNATLPASARVRAARRPKLTRLVTVCVLGVSRRSALLCGGARGAPGQDARSWGRQIGAGAAHQRPPRARGRQTAHPRPRRRSQPMTTQTAASATTASRPTQLPSSRTSWRIRLACPPRPAKRRRGARQGARAPSCATALRTPARAFLLLFFFLVSSSEYTLCATTTGAPPELNMPCAGDAPGV